MLCIVSNKKFLWISPRDIIKWNVTCFLLRMHSCTHYTAACRKHGRPWPASGVLSVHEALLTSLSLSSWPIWGLGCCSVGRCRAGPTAPSSRSPVMRKVRRSAAVPVPFLPSSKMATHHKSRNSHRPLLWTWPPPARTCHHLHAAPVTGTVMALPNQQVSRVIIIVCWKTDNQWHIMMPVQSFSSSTAPYRQQAEFQNFLFFCVREARLL